MQRLSKANAFAGKSQCDRIQKVARHECNVERAERKVRPNCHSLFHCAAVFNFKIINYVFRLRKNEPNTSAGRSIKCDSDHKDAEDDDEEDEEDGGPEEEESALFLSPDHEANRQPISCMVQPNDTTGLPLSMSAPNSSTFHSLVNFGSLLNSARQPALCTPNDEDV